jgi:hypothetical protein
VSTKVGDWSVSYKNGKIVLRQTIVDKYALSLDDLPSNPADMVEEVVKRLQAVDIHGFKPFMELSLPTVTRYAEAAIIEAGIDLFRTGGNK